MDRLSARVALRGLRAEMVDPGNYSLSARSYEEQVAVEAILGGDPQPGAVVVVADATTLSAICISFCK